jgi:hypothetical protein
VERDLMGDIEAGPDRFVDERIGFARLLAHCSTALSRMSRSCLPIAES